MDVEWKVAVSLEVKGTPPSDVIELRLDKHRLSLINSFVLSPYTELKYLSMNGVGLHSLENFPSLPKLSKVFIDEIDETKLELCDNNISGGLKHLISANLMNLASLNLSGTFQELQWPFIKHFRQQDL
jgi:acidic leucine-rich nuclear phosphoprotein 32 family member A/C/D